MDSVTARIDEGIYKYQDVDNYKVDGVVVELTAAQKTVGDPEYVDPVENYVCERTLAGEFIRVNEYIAGNKYYKYTGDYGVDRFQDYSANKIVYFKLTLLEETYFQGTYIKVDKENASLYADDERYSQRESDGRFVQDPNGLYVKDPITADDLINTILDLDAVKEALGGLEEGVLKSIVDGLIARLGLSVYLNDPFDNGFKIDLFGALDLEAIGFDSIVAGDFDELEIDLDTILAALDLGIEIHFNNDTAKEVFIGVYLTDGEILVDLSAINGPRIKVGLAYLLDLLGVGAEEAESEAIAAGEGDEALDIVDYLNILIKRIIFRCTPLNINGEAYKEGPGIDLWQNNWDSTDIYLNSTFLGDLLNALLQLDMDMSACTVDDARTGLFLTWQDTTMGRDKDEKLSIEARFVTSDSYTVSLKLGLGLELDIAKPDYNGVLSSSERREFVDISEYITNIIGLINGDVADYFITGGDTYYVFAPAEKGAYIFDVRENAYRLIKEGEEFDEAESVVKYDRFVAENAAGKLVYDGTIVTEEVLTTVVGTGAADSYKSRYFMLTSAEKAVIESEISAEDYYIFINDGKGNYAYNATLHRYFKKGSFEAGEARYTKYLVKYIDVQGTDETNLCYLTFKKAADGNYVFDASIDAYRKIAAGETVASELRYTIDSNFAVADLTAANFDGKYYTRRETG
ncbi:MAG: hypothetical protein MJ193_02535, partial [Clostridia bacterium]|nr:hypothetical protein [Clostridia bacterium]